MEFRVLGPMEVAKDGRLLDLGPRMHRAVLALLVMQANRVVSTDHLVDALWGEVPPASAETTLRGYVAGLRRALEPDRPARSAPQIVLTQPPGYLLRAEPDAIDAARFESLVSEGHERLAAGDPGAARNVLGQALRLWRGAPYADLASERFVAPEVARLQELQAAAAEARAEAELAVGEHGVAMTALEQLVTAEPLRERCWELYALALYRGGRQAEARRALDRARRILGEELGIEPRPSLRQLEQDILAQAPSLDWRPPEDHARPSIGAPIAAGPVAPAVASRTTPLVGRTRELSELDGALTSAIGGAGGVVLLAGEPGIGKTRLAEELSAHALVAGAHVVWGRCHEGAASPPFWPWTQIVRELVTEGDPEVVRGAVGGAAPLLAQIVPEVKEAVGGDLDPPVMVDPDTARARLFDAVGGLLRRYAAHRPVLVVLDDLQWADAASLQLLEVLADGLAVTPVLVVCTYREGDAHTAPAVLAALAALTRRTAMTRVRPGGLDDAEIGVLVAEATGASAAPGLVEAIRARTEGNPFFVAELVRLLQARGQLGDDAQDAIRGEIPEGVRDVIRLRLSRLPEKAQATLATAAVVGREFDVEVVAAAAGLGEDEAFELAEAWLLAGVVAEDREDPGAYRFSHDLVRETVYDGLSGGRRARLHRRVGQVLAGRADGRPGAALEVAHHLYLGAPAGGADEAVTWALRAAEQVSGTLALEAAEAQLQRALALLDRLPAAERPRRELAALTRLGSLLVHARGHDDPEACRVWQRARDLSEQVSDGGELLATLWGLWTVALVGGRCLTAGRLAEEVLTHGQRSGDPVFLAAGHEISGMTAVHAGALADARMHLEEAIARWGDLPPAAADVLLEKHPPVICGGFLAVALWLLGEDEVASRTGADALARARRLDHPFTLATVLILDAWRAVMRRDVGLAGDRADEAAELCRKCGFHTYLAICAVISAWARSAQGAGGPQAEEAAGVLATARAAGVGILRPFLLGLLADIQRREGEADAALRTVDEALAESNSGGERFADAELHQLRAELLAGRSPEGERAWRRALEVARAQHARALERRIEASLERR